MNYLFDNPECLNVYLSFVRIQKVLMESNLSYSLPQYIRDPDEICDYASEILFEHLPSVNDSLQTFDYYNSCYYIELVFNDVTVPFQFGIEEDMANIRETHNREDLEDQTSSTLLCLSSSYLTTEDYERMGNLHKIGGFPSVCGKAYMYEYIDNDYGSYTFEVWVMKLLEISIRLAALITERKRKNA